MERQRRLRIPIHDLGCSGTDPGILERVLASTEGVLAAYVNPATETAYVDIDPSELDAWSVSRVIARAGYRPGHPTEV